MNTFKFENFKAKTKIEKMQSRTPRHHKTMRAGLFLAAIAFGVVFYGLALSRMPETEAIEPSNFNAGRLIDDSIFYNPNTMSAADIQKFLDDKSPACDMWGTGLITDRTYPDGSKVATGTTRAAYSKVMREKYGKSQYHDPPYVCINKYYENPETHQTLYETQGVATAGMKSAAQIIYDVAQEYNTNPQVLLVMIKKESLVWGDNWPLKYEYNTVMGYGCPDNAPCNEAYYGFYNQVQKAAWQFKYYREHPTSYHYKPNQNNNIYYHPNMACGTKQVYLENIATTSLYIYTPYTPNDAALRAYPGTGDGCSSYGNRNFYMFFREWFGDTYSPAYEPMKAPRTMTISRDTMIIDTELGDVIPDTWLFQGENLYFDSKVEIYRDGIMQTCLRTSDDSDNNINHCVLFARLDEFTADNLFVSEKVYSVQQFTCPVNIFNMEIDCITFVNPGDIIRSSKKVAISGMEYIYSIDNNLWYRRDRVKNYDESWLVKNTEPFIMPRKIYIRNTNDISNIVTLKTCENINVGSVYYFKNKISINNKIYYLIDDAPAGCGIEDINTIEVNEFFENFLMPRNLVVAYDYKLVPILDDEECSTVKKGSMMYFDTKVNKNGIDYYRPSTSTSEFSSCSIEANALWEL